MSLDLWHSIVSFKLIYLFVLYFRPHDNTIKFLVGISPNGFITFLLDCYGGRALDKYITKDSVFCNLLE